MGKEKETSREIGIVRGKGVVRGKRADYGVQALELYGRVDILINNAGANGLGPVSF